MRAQLVFIGLVLVNFQDLSEGLRDRLIVWNVGQGLYTSLIQDHLCIHIDAGGEQISKKVKNLCRDKINRVYITHADWDHISHLYTMRRDFPKLCLIHSCPETYHPKKRKLLDGIPLCKNKEDSIVIEHKIFRKQVTENNDHSRVYQVYDILIPGDLSKKYEKQIRAKSIKTLVLGHHGSNTSSHSEFLNRLNKLRQTISSARQSKYGHPHQEVLKRSLAIPKLSVIRTEVWGSLIIEI